MREEGMTAVFPQIDICANSGKLDKPPEDKQSPLDANLLAGRYFVHLVLYAQLPA